MDEERGRMDGEGKEVGRVLNHEDVMRVVLAVGGWGLI